MNCPKCKSLKISTTIYNGKEVSRCWGCGFVEAKKVDCPEVKVKPRPKRVKKVKPQHLIPNPPNAIDRWLWSQGTQAINGAAVVDAMKAEDRAG